LVENTQYIHLLVPLIRIGRLDALLLAIHIVEQLVDGQERPPEGRALTARMIADDPAPPRWNESNPKTGKYVKASGLP